MCVLGPRREIVLRIVPVAVIEHEILEDVYAESKAEAGCAATAGHRTHQPIEPVELRTDGISRVDLPVMVSGSVVDRLDRGALCVGQPRYGIQIEFHAGR